MNVSDSRKKSGKSFLNVIICCIFAVCGFNLISCNSNDSRESEPVNICSEQDASGSESDASGSESENGKNSEDGGVWTSVRLPD